MLFQDKTKASKELKGFLKVYDNEIQKTTTHIRDYITKLIPDANELIWDNYNALAMAYSKNENLKDAFFVI